MKMSNWKIGFRISAAFAVVILICAAMSYFNYNRVRHIDSETVLVSDNTVPSVAALSHIQAIAYRELEILRKHAASSNQAEMDKYDAQIDALKEEGSKAYKQYEAFPLVGEEKELYAKVQQDRAQFWDLIAQIRKESRIGTATTNAITAQMIDTQLAPFITQYTDDVGAIVDLNNRGSKEGLARVRVAVNDTIRGTVFGLALAILLSALITMLIVRGITVPLAKAVSALDQVADGDLTVVLDVDTQDEVGLMAKALNKAVERLNSTMQEVADSAANASSSSQQLAAASEAIASGAQEQAASLEETSASLEEITATVRQSADNAQQASQLASGSKDSALQGQEVVTKAITAMSEINAASAKISDIISTIDEIAFQTNLLAVNAAVEAARAGDEGRGFAVVASEVRSLAQRSAVAAKEIKVLIQDSLRKVEAGSALVNRSGETLHGIVGSVKRVTDIVSEIAAASGEQSAGIEQVNTAMTQMDQVTQGNSAQTEELSATAEALSEQAAHLLELVGTFTLSNSGKGQRGHQAFQPHAANTVHQTVPTQRLSSAAHPPAKIVRSNSAARVTKHPKNLQPALSVAVPSGPAENDASFQEF
jgi:methyl-accepting chemotaxis protein